MPPCHANFLPRKESCDHTYGPAYLSQKHTAVALIAVQCVPIRCKRLKVI